MSIPTLLESTTGNYTTYYIYGPDGLPLEEILPSGSPSGSTYYYAHDALGSTRALTDSTGRVQNTDTYDPYGNITASSGTITNPLLYAGQYTDPETGLIYLRARYYDPTTAQFLTRDPLQAVTQQPYQYANGNPTNNTDPSGLACELNPLSGSFDPGGCVNDAAGFDVGGAALHAGLDVAAVPGYALYYGSYYAAKGINEAGSQLGTPGSVLSHVLAAPFAAPEGVGLGWDAGIDWIKGQTVNNESICDEGKVGYINPFHQWMPGPLKGPQTYLPGIHPNGQVDFQW